ncbi:hypothetical protein CcaCcLH18_08312 [Colletotrichum camelliae]|nr:hypothetical protein CcaCcLH18_08312 [Colletotrichum camelliae]
MGKNRGATKVVRVAHEPSRRPASIISRISAKPPQTIQAETKLRLGAESRAYQGHNMTTDSRNAQSAQNRKKIAKQSPIPESQLSSSAQIAGTNGLVISLQHLPRCRPPISPPQAGTEPRSAAAWLALGPGLQCPGSVVIARPPFAPPWNSQTLPGRNPGPGEMWKQGLAQPAVSYEKKEGGGGGWKLDERSQLHNTGAPAKKPRAVAKSREFVGGCATVMAAPPLEEH